MATLFFKAGTIMTANKIYSASVSGLEATLVEVEADQGGGEFGRISLVGLPGPSTNEAQERVRSAIKNSGYVFPRRKITVNLAPADIRKQGSQHDLAIALSILGLKNSSVFSGRHFFILGELSLSGEVKAVKKIFPLVAAAVREGCTEIFLPAENVEEISIFKKIKIFPITSLKQIADYVFKGCFLAGQVGLGPSSVETQDHEAVWQKIRGQNRAKRAAEISLAGGHHFLMIGPPGSGKTMIAQAMGQCLPPNSLNQALEIANIKSICGLPVKNDGDFFFGLFRAVHHSSSGPALLGGGKSLRPGEITLSHHGLLFLDELPQFATQTINALRQPMEKESIFLAHAEESCFFPCSFTLIATANPCPCGFWGESQHVCRCRPKQLAAYRRKIPGPVLDRFDLCLPVHYPEKTPTANYRPSAKNIWRARKTQEKRGFLNGRCPDNLLSAIALSSQKEKDFFLSAAENLHCSERGKIKILKIARTIADLAGEKEISISHLAEAFSLRSDDTICYN